MNVRTLEPSDAEQFRQLRLNGLQESPAAFGATYEEDCNISAEELARVWLGSGEDFLLGAFDDQRRLVGMVGFGRPRRKKRRHRASISGMYVSPEARGKGVGRALLNTLIQRANGLEGLEQIVLEVVSSETPARSLYLAHGFEIFGHERRALKVDGEHYDVEHMALYL